MAKEFFQAYHSYLELIKNLGDAETGRLFRAALVYSKSGEEITLRGNERFVFPAIQSQIERDSRNYAKKCRTNKKNASKRWDEDTGGHADTHAHDPSDAIACESCQREDEDEREDEREGEREGERNSLSCPHPDGSDGEGGSRGVRGTSAKNIFATDTTAYKTAAYLFDTIAARLPHNPQTQPGKHEATVQRWARDIDRLLRLDNAGRDMISFRRVLAFSQQDAFWQTVILSGDSLRKHYTRMLAKVEGGGDHAG